MSASLVRRVRLFSLRNKLQNTVFFSYATAESELAVSNVFFRAAQSIRNEGI